MVRRLHDERVRLVIPKPREHQRLVGRVDASGERVTVTVETGSGNHQVVTLRERERDGVLRAFRGTGDATLLGRVERVEVLDE